MSDAPRVISVREPLPATLPTRRGDLEVAEFDTEVVVWDPVAKMVHHLQGIAAIVFDACDGSTVTAHLIDDISEAANLPRPAVHDEVTTVWEMFHRRSLLALPPGVHTASGASTAVAAGGRQRRRRRA